MDMGTTIIASGWGSALEISEILEKAWHIDSLKCLKFANSAAKRVTAFGYSSLPIICASDFCLDIMPEVLPRQLWSVSDTLIKIFNLLNSLYF